MLFLFLFVRYSVFVRCVVEAVRYGVFVRCVVEVVRYVVFVRCAVWSKWSDIVFLFAVW